MNRDSWVLRYATSEEKRYWNHHIRHNPDGGTFLQTQQYATIKKNNRWRPRYFMYSTPHGTIAALALTKYIFPLGELWYFPKGPGVADVQDVARLAEANREFIRQHKLNVFLIKVEPQLVAEAGSTIEATTHRTGLSKAASIQAHTSTVLLPLPSTSDDLLKSLYRRSQKRIRQGMREAVRTVKVDPTEANLRRMYELMKTVSGGKGTSALRSYDYYRQFWRTFISADMGRLYFAYEDDTPVVGAFIILQGDTATYKDGGSLPGRTSKAAAYSLQWHIMKDMIAQGMRIYDLCGVPSAARINDPSHYLHGVGHFKTAFSKQVTDYIGVYDQVISANKFRVWRWAISPLIRRFLQIKRKLFTSAYEESL